MILQSDPRWATARLGHVTASRMGDMLAKTQKGWGAARANYAAELVAERLTGKAGERYVNGAMQWGIDTETEARAAYAFYRDASPSAAAFVVHPMIPFAGASPDGFVGELGLVEFKCPNTSTHIDTLLGGGIPEKYRLQMQWQLACTGREWCDFASYDPRLPENMRLFVRRFEADREEIARLERETRAFLTEIADTLAALEKKYAA
jgi:putative phage-type endonuclease